MAIPSEIQDFLDLDPQTVDESVRSKFVLSKPILDNILTKIFGGNLAPDVISVPNYTQLQTSSQKYIDKLFNGLHEEDDEEDIINDIFENALKARYGDDVFDKIAALNPIVT